MREQMRKEKNNVIYILILSFGFSAFSAWRALLDDKPVSFCAGNFAGIFLTGVCLAAAMHLFYEVKIRVAERASIRKAWLDTLHGAGDLVLIALWGSVYNQLVYVIDDGPVPASMYWLAAAAVIVLAAIVIFAYGCWKEKKISYKEVKDEKCVHKKEYRDLRFGSADHRLINGNL